MTEPETHTAMRGVRGFSVTCVVEALLLAGLLVLLSDALRPDFGGGRFAVFVVVIGIVLLSIALMTDIVAAVLTNRPSPETGRYSEQAPAIDAFRGEWPIVMRGLATIVGLFVLIFTIGTVCGMTIAAWILLRWHIGASTTWSTVIALGLGLVVPVIFSQSVGMPLWPGLVPELIPGWVGGGIAPSL